MTQNAIEKSPSARWNFLKIGAYVAIILWGVRTSSELLGPLLLGLMLAYAVAPFPRWLVKRFNLPRSTALVVTGSLLAASGLFFLLSMELGISRLATRLPIYEQRLAELYEQATVFASAHGIESASFSVKNVLTPERFAVASIAVLPHAGAVIAKGLLIFLLAFLLVTEMLPGIGGKLTTFGEIMVRHGFYSKKYVAVTAKTAGINAVVNLVFLLVMGVDEAVLWSVLYFFLDFIPTLGFVIALLPPTLVTLLMYGWERALAVACGLILTNLIVDNIVMPIFAKRAMSITFLEITLSLVGWVFLLGMPGAVIAIPLTLALKEFIATKLRDGQVPIQPSE
jgi:AI-2 transport protein TqsA